MSRLAAGLTCAIVMAAPPSLTARFTRSSGGQAGPSFAISFPSSAHAGPITGRVFVMISRTNDREPRMQIGRLGVPFFGRDVERLAPAQAATIDATDLGTPVESLREIPAGDYFVQGFVNVYSEFKRADGHTLWMHDDQWEGQRWNISPGNLKSAVQKVHLDPTASTVVQLSASDVIPPIAIAADTDYVKRFKFQSPMLTKFWGRPIFIGATVLLPKDYATETISYPVHYIQGHFGVGAPNGFNGQNVFSQEWLSATFPRMILVTFQHPTPYFDDSYAVNSVNVGPYSDAIMQELIPEIEKRYRTIKQPYARTLSGGSTGGWESLALQIFHPEFFGGTWSSCPDSVTFTDVEGINVYADKNAFYKEFEWRRTPTVNSRETNGQIRQTSEQRNHFELVNGTHGRSGEQIDIWSAVFGPIGKDGYFEPLFDKRTGVMNPNPAVAQYWKDNFDLLEYLKRNWTKVGPQLVDKLHVYTGTMDTYLLNNSTQQLEQWLSETKEPHYTGFFMYGDRKPHCWSGPGTPGEKLKEIAQFMIAKKPDGAATPWWRY